MDILRGLLSYAKNAGGASVPLQVNGSDELLVSIGSSGAVQDVNLEEVAGAAVAATSVAGTVPVETDHRKVAGSAIAATSVAGTFPVETDHRQVAGSAIAATSVAGTLPVETDHRKIAGNTIATTGVSGAFPFEGVQATGISLGTQYPILIGGEIVDVPDAKTDGHFWNSILDDYRRMWMRSAAHNELTNGDQVENLNLISTDFDKVYEYTANESNVAAGSNYYPNSNGALVGTKTNLGFVVDITQGALDIEVSNDQSTWIPATKTLFDVEQNSSNYDNTHYNEAAGGSATFGIIWHKIEFAYYRFKFVRSNATNAIEITRIGRAH
jgi:hypothetical protein